MSDAPPWFRMKRNITESVKVFKLPPPVFRHWVLFLACTDDDGVLADLETVAHRLRMTPTEAEGALTELVGYRLFDRQPDGTCTAHDWDDHNPKTAAHRMRKMRQRKKAASGGDAERYAGVTPSVTHSGDEGCDGKVTYRADKSRGDTEKKQPSAAAERSVVGCDDWVPSAEQIDAVFDRWNVMAASTGLSKVTPTDERRIAVSTLMETLDGPQVVINAFDTIPKSPFLIGQGKNGWKANFDFIIKPGNFAKLREGLYRDERRRK